MTGTAELAYEVYRNMDVSSESLVLLDFIANECFKVHTTRHKMLNVKAIMRSVQTDESLRGHYTDERRVRKRDN